MNVVFSDESQADLAIIGDFIRQQNPKRAASFVLELIGKCTELEDMPKAFPLVPRYEYLNIRRRVVFKDYLIFYYVDAENINIVHILHGAQDYEALLFPQDK